MIADITEKTETANKQEAECSEKKAFLEVQNAEIAVKKGEADRELEAARPIIEEAQAALGDIHQKELTELRTVQQPTASVLKVCQIAFYLYCDPKDQKDDSWAALK